MTEKITCRTPAKGRDGVTNIPKWKFEAVRRAILDAIGPAGDDGFPFVDLQAAVAERLSEKERAELGSVGWHATTVKLEMEVSGELQRTKKAGAQRLLLVDRHHLNDR